jgi:hypothetical protein
MSKVRPCWGRRLAQPEQLPRLARLGGRHRLERPVRLVRCPEHRRDPPFGPVWARAVDPAAGEVTITLRHPQHLHGSVTDAETGRPIERFTLIRGLGPSLPGTRPTWYRNPQYTRTDQNGRFAFDRVAPGVLTVGRAVPGKVNGGQTPSNPSMSSSHPAKLSASRSAGRAVQSLDGLIRQGRHDGQLRRRSRPSAKPVADAAVAGWLNAPERHALHRQPFLGGRSTHGALTHILIAESLRLEGIIDKLFLFCVACARGSLGFVRFRCRSFSRCANALAELWDLDVQCREGVEIDLGTLINPPMQAGSVCGGKPRAVRSGNPARWAEPTVPVLALC